MILEDHWEEYSLLDSGRGLKLERFGRYTVIREEIKAWWKPRLIDSEWKRAVARHEGASRSGWTFNKSVPREWLLRFDDLTLEARLTSTSKHVGVFPEQSANWSWLRDTIKISKRKNLNMLNLFGYTGVATLIAAAEGTSVTHVDASKGVVEWARHNQKLSGLQDRPVRWIIDDAIKFVGRENRRGRRYDIVVMDPPSFGRGPKRELWKIEKNLPEVLLLCKKTLSDNPLCFLITMYSIDQSCLLIANLLHELLGELPGNISVGELVCKPSHGQDKLSMAIFGRWNSQ